MYANGTIYNRNRLAASTQDPDALREALEAETKEHEGFFSETLGGIQLIRDNDNFCVALVNFMPPTQVSKLMGDMKVPKSAPHEVRVVLLAMAFSEVANNMNISLRQEMTRVALSKAMIAETVADAEEASKLAGLGIFVELAIAKFIQDAKVKSLPDFFEKLGKSIGHSLQAFGESILSIRDYFIDKWGEVGRYFSDFLITTPGGKFIFGNLAREVGIALQTGDFTWEIMAAAGSQYMKDMAIILSVLGVVAPPPWNLIAKLVSILYKAASRLIDWQLAKHIKSLMEESEAANKEARELYEQEMMEFAGALYASIPPSTSEYGSNSTTNPAGGYGMASFFLVAGLGILAVLMLGK